MNSILKELIGISSSLDGKGHYVEADFLDNISKQIVKLSAEGDLIGATKETGAEGGLTIDGGTSYTLDSAIETLLQDGAEEFFLMKEERPDGATEYTGLQELVSIKKTLEYEKKNIVVDSDGGTSRLEGDSPGERTISIKEGLRAFRPIAKRMRSALPEDIRQNFETLVGGLPERANSELSSIRAEETSGLDYDFVNDEDRIRESKRNKAKTPEGRASLDMNTPATEEIRLLLGKSRYSLEGLIGKYEEKLKIDSEEAGLTRSIEEREGVPSGATMGPRRVDPKKMEELRIPRQAKKTLELLKTRTRPTDGKTFYEMQLDGAEAARDQREANREAALEHPNGENLLYNNITMKEQEMKSRDIGNDGKERLFKELSLAYNDYEYFFGEGFEATGRTKSAKRIKILLRDFWPGCQEFPCEMGWAYDRNWHKDPKSRPEHWPTRDLMKGDGTKYTWRPIPRDWRDKQRETDRQNQFITEFDDLTQYTFDRIGYNDTPQDAYNLMKSVLYSVPLDELSSGLRGHGREKIANTYLMIGAGNKELDDVIKNDVMKFFASRLKVSYNTDAPTKDSGFGASKTVDEQKLDEERKEQAASGMLAWLEKSPITQVEDPNAATDLPTLDTATLEPEEEMGEAFNPALTEEQRKELEEQGLGSESSVDMLTTLVSLSNRLDAIGLIKESDYLDKILFRNF